MDRMLLVHENEDFRDLLASEIQETLREAVQIDRFSAYDGALRAIAAGVRFRFGIWGAEAPASDEDARKGVSQPALKSSLPQLMAACPSFLVMATVDDDDLRHAVTANPNGSLAMIAPDSDWLEASKRLARAAFGIERVTHETHRTRAVIQIDMWSETQGQWRIERRGRVQGTQEGTMLLDRIMVDDLRLRTEELADQLKKPDWARFLPPVGHDVNRLLLGEPGHELRTAFDELLSEVGGPENVRVVFGLPKEHHVLPVEALKRLTTATSANEWYALQSAVLRRYQGSGPLDPLFWDARSREAPVDCLLIAADPRPGMGCVELTQVEYEVDDIAQILREQKKAGANIGRVEVLKLNGNDAADTELGKQLRAGEWKLVHFAGHADVRLGNADRGPSGVLALNPAANIFVEFAAVARVLPHTQFLFVSSCRSANAAFLHEVIRQSIPAVLGYRWPVDDAGARNLAKAFYSALFTRGRLSYKSVARAVSSARKEAFDTQLGHVTWAAPILLAKSSALPRIELIDACPNEPSCTGAPHDRSPSGLSRPAQPMPAGA